MGLLVSYYLPFSKWCVMASTEYLLMYVYAAQGIFEVLFMVNHLLR